MLRAWTRVLLRWQRLVLIVVALLVVAAGVFGASAQQYLRTGGYVLTTAPSQRAVSTIQRDFHTGTDNLVVLASMPHRAVTGPAAAASGARLTTRLAHWPHVQSVTSYWSTLNPALHSRHGHFALILAQMTGTSTQITQRTTSLMRALGEREGGLHLAFGGSAAVNAQTTTQIASDLARAEAISVPVTLLLLVFVFGSVVSAALPLLVGGVAIVGTLAILRLLGSITHVSVFALNLTTALGLGLAVDYSLFIVSRFREELRAGHDTPEALLRTMTTAGQTVAFSALTVAAAFLALLAFPTYFLRSFGYAGIPVVLLAAAGALVLLPALLALLGRRVNALSVRRQRAAAPARVWTWIGERVTAHPLRVAVPVVVLLAVSWIPFLHARFSLPGASSLPTTASSRQVANVVQAHFVVNPATGLSIVVAHLPAATAQAEVAAYEGSLRALPGVAQVHDARLVTNPGGSAALLSLSPVNPSARAQQSLLSSIQHLHAPGSIQIAGAAAVLHDNKAEIGGALPAALAVIVVVSLLLLFALTGSVLLPFEALAVGFLSLGAVYGALVLVFQDGHLASLFGFDVTGSLDTAMPVLMFCVVFGLSMDYEVFLLSRVKEERDRSGDGLGAITAGLAQTGGIITAAALLLAAVFAAFATSQVSVLELFGFGTALAVVVDATVVRALLVPVLMRLGGRATWWAPAPLQRLAARLHDTGMPLGVPGEERVLDTHEESGESVTSR